MKNTFRYLLVITLLLGLALSWTPQERVMAAEDLLSALVNDNNAFALDLYQQIITEADGNVVFSPYSISQAFGMVVAGARGDTEQQIMDTMRFRLSQEDLHRTFDLVNTMLVERESPDTDPEAEPLQLNIANSLWGQTGYPFRQSYLDTLGEFYDGELRLVDFALTEEAREAINTWIEDQTEDKIQDMIPSGLLLPLTRLVLVNAIYFNASWLYPFEEAATGDDIFTLLDGSTVTVPMMRQQEHFDYVQGEGFQAVELPYYPGDTAMLIVLPDEDAFTDFEAALDGEQFNQILQTLIPTEIRFFMPRFEYDTDIGLRPHLLAMGMTDAFDAGEADFTGMYDPEQAAETLFIGDALHKAYIGVDEAGTEAAAATAVIMVGTAAPSEPPPEVRLDRPFLYAIYDKLTGSILFLGRVLNPAE